MGIEKIYLPLLPIFYYHLSQYLGEGGGWSSLSIYIPLSISSLPLLLSTPSNLYSSVFYVFSLSCPRTLIYLSLSPLLTKRWGTDSRGEGDVDKRGRKHKKRRIRVRWSREKGW